jgi:hypothetical protein
MMHRINVVWLYGMLLMGVFMLLIIIIIIIMLTADIN